MSKPLSDETVEIPISARRTESLDAPDILKLVTNETYKLFGRVNVAHMMYVLYIYIYIYIYEC